MKLINGAYAVVLTTENAVYAFRDPHGVRPLVLGKLDESRLGGRERDVRARHRRRRVRARRRPRRDDQDQLGGRRDRAGRPGAEALAVHVRVRLLRAARLRDGRLLACTRRAIGWAPRLPPRHRSRPTWSWAFPTRASRPPSATRPPAACRSARGSRRTATSAARSSRRARRIRQQGIQLKLNPLKHAIRGKRLIVVDDSIVRGNTTKKLVALLREAGAAEVHMRITSPPVVWPCFYGIDTDTQEQLIASRLSRRGDPRAHRRRLARLPLARRDGRGHRSGARTTSASRASTASTRSRSRESVKTGQARARAEFAGLIRPSRSRTRTVQAIRGRRSRGLTGNSLADPEAPDIGVAVPVDRVEYGLRDVLGG